MVRVPFASRFDLQSHRWQRQSLGVVALRGQLRPLAANLLAVVIAKLNDLEPQRTRRCRQGGAQDELVIVSIWQR